MALTDNLISYWKLDEESGSRTDVHGSNNLSDGNTVTFNSGKINNAAQFTAANSEYLYITEVNGTGLDMTGDMSAAVWVYFDTEPVINDEYEIIKSHAAYVLAYRNHGGTYKLWVCLDSGSGFNCNASLNWDANVDTWYYLTMVYDASAGEVEIFVNASSIGTGTGAPTSLDGGSSFLNIGSHGNGDASKMNGRMDEIGIWDRKLIQSEVTELYNSGDGLAYPFSTTNIKTINNISKANVKTWNNILIANVKTINGLA